MTVITLTTDFGLTGSYVAQMKGVILGINPEVRLVDITHKLPPQDIRTAAFVLDTAVDAFPTGTVHLVVVDPGVGTDRDMIAVDCGEHRFVAPDNGVLSFVLDRLPPRNIMRLDESQRRPGAVGTTFDGRDIMGPVAARWSLTDDDQFPGEPITTPPVTLAAPIRISAPDAIIGEVIFIDRYGNAVTSIDRSQLKDITHDRLVVTVGRTSVIGLKSAYGNVPSGTALALINSSGRLELAINQDNAASCLGLVPGQEVIVSWPDDAFPAADPESTRDSAG